MKHCFFLFLSFIALLLTGCASRAKAPDENTLISIQLIDRNGFSETISAKERLTRHQTTDFCDPQPYQKVLRVFGKNSEGKNPSILTSYHSNGQLWQYLEVSNGRAHGTYSEWHFNGSQKMKFHVIEGIPELSEAALKSWVFDGTNEVWDENGALLAKICYEKGMMQGESLYYYQEGQIKKKIPYEQDEVHGELLCYYEDGTLSEKIPHTKGLRHGTAVSFFPNGTPSYEETFEKGLLIKGRYYNKEGALTHSIDDGSGKRCEWEDGILKRVVAYQKGVPEGLVECFDEKGFLFVSFHQKEGKKNGEEWVYYPESSQPKMLLHWQNDMLQGLVKTWFSTGSQESQKEMYQNKKNGLSFAWYANGDLMLSEEYEKDVLTSGSYYKKGDKKPVSKVFQGKGTAVLYHPEGYLLQKVFYDKGIPSLDPDLIK